jgi:hypothetical protein
MFLDFEISPNVRLTQISSLLAKTRDIVGIAAAHNACSPAPTDCHSLLQGGLMPIPLVPLVPVWSAGSGMKMGSLEPAVGVSAYTE